MLDVTVSPSRATTWLRLSEITTGEIWLASVSRAAAVAVSSRTTLGRIRGSNAAVSAGLLFG